MAGFAVVVLWASAFPAIRVAAPGLGVIGLSVVRLAVASLALLAIAPLARVRRPERRHLPLLVAAAFFGMTAYQLLLNAAELHVCLLYTSPSPRDGLLSRMPSSA